MGKLFHLEEKEKFGYRDDSCEAETRKWWWDVFNGKGTFDKMQKEKRIKYLAIFELVFSMNIKIIFFIGIFVPTGAYRHLSVMFENSLSVSPWIIHIGFWGVLFGLCFGNSYAYTWRDVNYLRFTNSVLGNWMFFLVLYGNDLYQKGSLFLERLLDSNGFSVWQHILFWCIWIAFTGIFGYKMQLIEWSLEDLYDRYEQVKNKKNINRIMMGNSINKRDHSAFYFNI